MYEDPRQTANRFVGGAEHRLANLTRLLEHVAEEQEVERETLFEWLVEHTRLQEEGTLNKHLRFIIGSGLLDKTGERVEDPGVFGLGPYGVKAVSALENPDEDIAHVLFDALANNVSGFDQLLDELREHPIDIVNRAAVLEEGYDGREFSDDVAKKHYVWLEAIGYIKETDGQYVLTDLGGKAVDRTRESLQSLSARGPSPLREWSGSPTPESGRDPEQEVSYVADVGDIVEKSQAHEDALDVLVDHLAAEGFSCQYTDHSDLLATRGDTVVLVEAKTITATSAMTQIRSAIGQLFEYEFYDVEQRTEWAAHDVVTCLYLANPPGAELAEYLRHLPSRGIEVLWQDAGSIDGPAWPDLARL